jgi:uncharacterized integral membrane protein
MVRTFLKALILVPIAVFLILFAVANRQWTGVSLDPFSSEPPALAIHLPLFLVILLAVMLGVIVGGIAVWLGQRRWRRAARRLETELREAGAETQAWKRRAEAEQAAAAPLAPLTYRPPPAA